MPEQIKLQTSSVLITGGSSGIGKSLARRFLLAGSTVLATGRNEEKLKKVAHELPGLQTIINDIGKTEDREKLADYLTITMPGLNVIINNAGIQRRVELAADNASWGERQAEMDNFVAGPIHLNHLLIPILLGHKKPSLIVNVTSRAAFIPQVWAPLYSASKAALHSYTVSLRDALKQTNCRVVELIPPPIEGVLQGGGKKPGVPLETFVEDAFNKMTNSISNEIGFGITANLDIQIAGKPFAELLEESLGQAAIKRY